MSERDELNDLRICEICERRTGVEAPETMVCVLCWNRMSDRMKRAEARAEQLEAALQFYISRCRQPHETVNAHYERLAEEFHNKTGLTAPGKSLPVEMEALRDREKEIEAWHEFHDEPLENAREALEQQDATEATEKPVWVRYDVAPQIAEDALRRKLIKLGWTPPQCPYCKHGKQHCCAHIGEFICTRPLGHKGPHVACGEETHEIARGDDHE